VESDKGYVTGANFLNRFDHNWKIKARRQRRDIGNYSFGNRLITGWNRLPEGAIGTSNGKKHILQTNVRKVKTGEGK